MSAPSRPSSRSAQPLPEGLPAPGEVLASKYVVERVLGLGGMGAVLLARHVELDERVAIKMLLPSATPLSPTAEPVTRFIREARAAIKIRNEHVVRILDVGRLDDGRPYIVMEYLEGSDLARLVEDSGPLPVDDAIEYVVQACEAIAAAHAMGIVHRDLKPANIFLARTGDGRPCIKVLDFGISKISGSSPGASGGLTSTTTIMGTPCFMSPEQLRSTRDVDARADIWSMGAILHALLTGTPPYDGESNADVSAKIIRDLPTPVRQLRPEVPEDLEAIILRCLEKDPAARFPDVAELAQALAAVTVRDSVKSSAARVMKGSFATAPTLASVPPAPLVASGPTRTASAWGETGRQDSGKSEGARSSRRLVGAIAAIALVAGLATLGLVRLQHAAPVAAASASAPPSAAVTVAPPPTPDPPSPSASTAPTATASTSTSMLPIRPIAGPGSRRPTSPSKPDPSAASPATAPATPPAPAKPAGGLFDGRE
jgi:eukaryotic-like serine/threonine-protein kinase